MKLDCGEYVVDIIQLENRKTESKYKTETLEPLDRETSEDEASDSPRIFKIDGYESEDDSIITVSNLHFPNFVSEVVEKINTATSRLPPQLSRHILRPSATGYYGVQSYAFWPRLMPISNKRLIKKAQILTVNKKLFQWLCDVAKTSQLPIESDKELTARYIDPLNFLIDQDHISPAIKRIASDTLKSLDARIFRPVSILEHGDFWYGNILLERSWPFSLNSFFIIDWGGANIRGYPYVDQLRYLMSIGYRDKSVSRYLNLYSDRCALPIYNIDRYVCAYAGYLGMNRNEFPMDQYLRLIDTLISTASKAKNSIRKL